MGGAHQLDVTNQFANPKFEFMSFYLFVSIKKKKINYNTKYKNVGECEWHINSIYCILSLVVNENVHDRIKNTPLIGEMILIISE